MVIKTVSVTYGRKHNLGDFSSAHAEITLWAELEEGENEESATVALREMARNNVMNELGRVDQRLKARTEDLFMGLPAELRKSIELKQTPVDEDGNSYTIDRNGVRNYRGKNADRAIASDLASLDEKYGYYED